jgi:CHAD domain-containing protein
MRYAVEFFGSLFHPHSAERYIVIAQALQDLLGQQNDATVALGLVKTLDFGADAELAYAVGVAAGWLRAAVAAMNRPFARLGDRCATRGLFGAREAETHGDGRLDRVAKTRTGGRLR